MSKEIVLRDYQKKAIDTAMGEFVFGTEEVTLYSPTGSGKTFMAAEYIRRMQDEGMNVLFMMNLTSLVAQTMDSLDKFNLKYNVIAAEYDGREGNHPANNITIAMQQTLHARIDKWEMKEDTVLIIDERHRSFGTKTMKEVIRKVSPERILSLSATPYDKDGYALPGTTLVDTISIKELTENGSLATVKTYVAKFFEEIDYSDSTGPEYSEVYLEGKLNTPSYNEQVVDTWIKIGKGRKTAAFCSGIQHAVDLAETFKRRGINAEAYHSNLSKEEQRLRMQRFRNLDLDILVSVDKLNTGFDYPELSCLLMCRPTQILSLYRQIIGRITRPAEGKEDAILIDCSQGTKTHGFYDDPYSPPEFGDSLALAKAKKLLSAHETNLIAAKEPTLITREIVDSKVEEIKRKSEDLTKLKIDEVITIFNQAYTAIDIVSAADEINSRKGKRKMGKPQAFWISSAWDDFIKDFPAYEDRIIKTMKTRAQNIVRDGKKLASLHYFPEFLRKNPPYSDIARLEQAKDENPYWEDEYEK